MVNKNKNSHETGKGTTPKNNNAVMSKKEQEMKEGIKNKTQKEMELVYNYKCTVCVDGADAGVCMCCV